jgi:glutamate--cysteine ligase
MQTISGIHYNWSMPGLDNDAYFALIRNFRRHAFVLLYLFGASPAGVRKLRRRARPRAAASPAAGTLHLPHATSLRMGRLGYQSDAQASLAVSYNSLESYANSLHEALTRPYPPTRHRHPQPGGDYNQLATTLLQIENEFYGTIRPKRVIRPASARCTRCASAASSTSRCAAWTSTRSSRWASTAGTMRFIDIFLLHCLLADSPPDTPAEMAALGRNQHRTAARGREPGLLLWAGELLQQCRPIAETVGAALGDPRYLLALDQVQSGLAAPQTLPSARVLDAMQRDFESSYTRFVRAQSQATRERLLALPYPPTMQARFEAMARESVEQQCRIEAADTMPFEIYRQQYLAAERLGR